VGSLLNPRDGDDKSDHLRQWYIPSPKFSRSHCLLSSKADAPICIHPGFVGDMDDLRNLASEMGYATPQISCPGVVHRGVDLVADEEREHVIGEDLAQTQAQGQIGHRLPGPGQRIQPLPVNDDVERPPPSADLLSQPAPATAWPSAP
jgi:hypothetical protein